MTNLKNSSKHYDVNQQQEGSGLAATTKDVGGSGVPGRSKTEKRADFEQDYPIKLQTAKALAAAGLYVRINVSLSEPDLLPNWSGKLGDLTDVDILGISYNLDFQPDIVCISCKSGSGKGLSPIRESFHLAGVMQYLGARRGHVVLTRKRIAPHMLNLAERLSIGLMDEPEWQAWCKQIAGHRPPPVIFEESVNSRLLARVGKWTEPRELLAYLRSGFWYYRDFRNIQNLIAHLKKTSKILHPNPLGHFVVRDSVCLLYLSLLELCAFIRRTGIARLQESVPPYLFGGAATYKSRRELLIRVEQILRKYSVIEATASLPSLDPPYSKDLMELTLRLVSRPLAAIEVPRYLLWRVSESAAEVAEAPKPLMPDCDEFTVKFASDVMNFVINASGLDAAFTF